MELIDFFYWIELRIWNYIYGSKHKLERMWYYKTKFIVTSIGNMFLVFIFFSDYLSTWNPFTKLSLPSSVIFRYTLKALVQIVMYVSNCVWLLFYKNIFLCGECLENVFLYGSNNLHCLWVRLTIKHAMYSYVFKCMYECMYLGRITFVAR